MSLTTEKASVVISTRGRGRLIVPTVAAILQCEYPDFELIVVDQSVDNDLEAALQPLLADERLRLIRTDTVGTGRSRNIGLRAATGKYVLYTDDDCLVSPEWIEKMVAPFQQNDQVAVVFCPVTPLVKEKRSRVHAQL